MAFGFYRVGTFNVKRRYDGETLSAGNYRTAKHIASISQASAVFETGNRLLTVYCFQSCFCDEDN